MFERLEVAPADPILGLTEIFKQDPRPHKINLGVGVYKDEHDQTPILDSVKRAETRLLEQEKTKNYLPIPGDAVFGALVQGLLFGEGHEIIASKRAASAHTPGGTGGLRVAADFIHQQFPGATVWISDPTWVNHAAIFKSAGLNVKTYPYYDYAAKALDFAGMMNALQGVAEGDVLLLHGCCHNPSGMDPDQAQWGQIAAFVRDRKVLPLFDFAYQGFGDGIEEDAAGLRQFCTPGQELLICSSFSKNFGLYKERVGILTLVAADADALERGFSNVKISIRTNYSSPPAHGGAVVSIVLGDPELRALWVAEVKAMRDRINGMRRLFVDSLKQRGVTQDFEFIATQKGMFSFSGLTKAQVERLRDEYALYIVGSGRINVAGMTPTNMDAICDAIAAVL
jgi:aspartate/tyrosine/aromatic aminotransferase